MIGRIVESKAFEIAIQVLIVVSLIGFCFETLPGLGSQEQRWLVLLERVAIGVFTVEYVVRIVAAERRLRYITSFYGIIDLAAVLPFYIVPHIDLLPLRALRLLRVFRVLKLMRYSRAMDRIANAVRDIREELVLYAVAAIIVIFLSSAGIYHFESEAQPDRFGSIFHCMWWSVVSLTTVGYGDVLPITFGGRLFA